MTIKEQLHNGIIHPWDSDLDTAVANAEFVVEDVAIKFGLYVSNNTSYSWESKDKIYFFTVKGIDYTAKELFELFKKENNL